MTETPMEPGESTSPPALPPPPPDLPDIAEAVLPEAVGMVVLDLDGTCLDGRQQLHPRTAAAVTAAARRVPVVIATGRMYRSALPWARRLGVTTPILCYQGAWALDLPEGDAEAGQVLFKDELRGSIAQSAVTVARTNGWHVLGFQDDQALAEEARPESEIYARTAAVSVDLVTDLYTSLRRGATKVVCVIEDPAEVARCGVLMRLTLGEMATVTRSTPRYLEVTSATATKARGLERLRALLGISGTVVAVGDAPNDATLLDAADLGVAVRGNDHDLLAHASCTCGPPEEAGVADVLRALHLSDE